MIKKTYLFLSILLILLFSSIFLIELLNLRFFEENNRLVNSGYYKNYQNKTDPYNAVRYKQIHPYYFFSIGYKKEPLKKINNDILNLNEFGFRVNPNNKNLLNKKNKIVLLGGSSAFSHYSSSDKNSIAAIISDKANIIVDNLNMPSWNSLQEAYALLNYKSSYDISISFSGFNDFANCEKFENSENYLDAVESYGELENRIYRKITLKRYFKNSFKNILPDTTKNILAFLAFLNPTLGPTYHYDLDTRCYKFLDDAKNKAKFFIKNQKNMHNLSNGRSGKHILVIQPVLSLHDSIDKNNLRYSDKKIEFLNVYYNEILKSNLCKNYIKCLDLSKMFNNKSNLKSFRFNSQKLDANQLYFIDDVHLSDLGNIEVAKTIIEFIKI